MTGPALVHGGPYGRCLILEMRSSLVTHAHPQAHILLKLAGADNGFVVGREERMMTDDDVVLVDSWQPHVYRHGAEAKTTDVLAIYVEPEWMQRVLGRRDIAFPASSVALSPAHRRALLDISDAVRAEVSSQCGLFEERLAAAVKGVFVDLVRENLRGSMDFRIRKTIADLSKNFGSFRSLAEVARRNGISRPHMFSLFRKYTDLTPHVFYNMCRMEAAIRGLEENGLSVGDISDELGFSAQSNFTRFFRQHQGISPIAYRSAKRLSS